MAVAHAFHHDSRSIRPALENATTTTASAVFVGDRDAGNGCGHLPPAGAVQQAAAVAGHTHTVVSSDPRSELTCNKKNRKGAGLIVMEGHRALLPVPQAEDAHQGGRVLCSAAASTSGRLALAAAAPVSQPQHGILAHLYRHGVEMDALVRIQNERLRVGLEEARRRHVRAVVSAVERGAARRLRAAEADLERALARNAELGEKVREMGAEGQAWQGIASGHEAAAAGLRATLEQLLLQQAPPPCEVEDALSCCCFEPEPEEQDDQQARGARACRACCAAEACVLLLPCRHLCLCGGCEALVEACPVCAATKNASLHVLLS